MDAATRIDAMADAHFMASLGHFQELLAVCESGDPGEIARVVSCSTMDRPDGRYLVATSLAKVFLGTSGLCGTDAGVDDAEFADLLADRAVPLFEKETWPDRQAAATAFLLAYLRDDVTAQFALTDKHGDAVLYALAELFAGLHLVALLEGRADRPAWRVRLEAIPLERMMKAATVKYGPLVAVMCRRDPAEWRAVLDRAVGGDADERFLMASFVATGIVIDMGLEASMGLVLPKGPQVEALLPIPAGVVVMEAGTFADRVAIARRFLCHFLGEDPQGQLALADEHGDALLYGLCEWATAVCTAKDSHGH